MDVQGTYRWDGKNIVVRNGLWNYQEDMVAENLVNFANKIREFKHHSLLFCQLSVPHYKYFPLFLI